MTDSNVPPHKDLRLRVTLALAFVIAMTVLSFSVVTFRAFDEAIVPELRQRMDILGKMLRDDLQRTLELGIPIDAIAGFDDKVATTVTEFPEVQRVRIVANSREVLLDIRNGEVASSAESGLGTHAWTNTYSVLVGSKIAAEIELVGDPRQIETRLMRVLIDIGVIALAIILFGVEVILALAARNIWLPRTAVTRLLEEQRAGRFEHVISVPLGGPLRQLAERMSDRALHLFQKDATKRAAPERLEVSLPVTGRLPMFLLAFGTETTASFLPIMARNSEHIATLPSPVAAALPLVLYLVGAAIFAPIATRLIGRFGPQKVFLWAFFPIVAGLIAMAASPYLVLIALGRMIVGAGYTLAAVACSAFMLRAGAHGTAAQTQASLNTALYGGVLAGSVIGGIVAYEVSFPVAIMLGGVGTALAALAARWGLSGPAGTRVRSQPKQNREARNALSFVLIVACLAVPASATTAIVIWYLMPMTLSQMGYETTIIARIVMLYYLAAILIAPLAGQLSRALKLTERFAAIFGTSVAALSLLAGGLTDLAPVYLIALLGIGHAVLRAPLYALVVSYSGTKASWIANYRLAERLGSILAFVTVFFVYSNNDPTVILTSLGALSLMGSVLFGVISQHKTMGEEVPT